MTHCVKSVQIWSFSGPYFPVFGLNTEIYSINLRMRSKYRKIRSRKNSVFGHFSCSDFAVNVSEVYSKLFQIAEMELLAKIVDSFQTTKMELFVKIVDSFQTTKMELFVKIVDG